MSSPGEDRVAPEEPAAPEPAAPGEPAPGEPVAEAGDPAAGTEEADVAPGGNGGVEEAAARIEADLDAVLRERDEYLEALRRLQADFENYRKRVVRQQTEHLEHAAAGLVEKLLPALDAADAAVAHGADAVAPVLSALLDVLAKEGLERLEPDGEPFDPNEHEAVAHEPGESDDGGSVVTEVLRVGYRWKGRVLRPAMVKVRG